MYPRMWNKWVTGKGEDWPESVAQKGRLWAQVLSENRQCLMACRCSVHENQSQTIRWHLSFYQVFSQRDALGGGSCRQRTSTFILAALKKTYLMRAHASTQTKPRV